MDFLLKIFYWNESLKVRLEIWDIAGQERFGSLTRIYYRESLGGIVVIDITRMEDTLSSASKWKRDMDEKVYHPSGRFPVILFANKCDLVDISISTREKLDSFCRENYFIGW